jgi:hypothetical protein
MSALQAIDQNAFRKRVEEHITNTFGSLIPEAEFAKLVDAQVKDFFETAREYTITERRSPGGYGAPDIKAMNIHVTPFQQMVWAVLQEILEKQLKEHLRGENSAVSKLIQDLIEMPAVDGVQLSVAQQCMLKMAGALFGESIQIAGTNARHQIAQVFLNNNMPDIGFKIQNG